ncbi:chain-length determining protein [Gammaproteobacteria bacterium]|nr:chain-length determining protein [Gammaproteobacteria bacterium]
MNTLESKIPGVETQVDLLVFISAIVNSRYRVLLFAFLAGASAYAMTYLVAEQYEAFTRIILVEPDDPGGVSPDNRRAPEVMTLVEHGFILGTSRDNLRDVIMAKMRSRTFTDEFIEKAGVAKYLFPELWDEGKGDWIGPEPDSNLVFAEFHEKIRFIDHDPKTDIMSVRIRFSDPRLAAKWANQYVSEFNLYMRKRALQDATMKREYLVKQVQSTGIVEMQKSIYRLIEAQTAVMMLTESKTEFSVEVLDRAYDPFERFSPARKRITLLTVVGAVLLGVFFVCAQVVIRMVRGALKAHP